MRVAITGGSGAIGTYVCDEFIRAGHEVVSVDIRPPKIDVPFVEVDLCDFQATCKTLQGFDQVVHLAAIPDPFSDPPEKVMGVNMMTAFNVFEAARLNGVRRVVYGCSESSTGFGIHNVPLKPLYVPIDEEHPCWPHETYSLSKHFGERIGDNYAKAYGLEVISLRYAWVWLKRSKEAAARVVARARQGVIDEKPWFGAYIAVRDVARACLAAANYRFGPEKEYPFEVFFLTARNTFYPIPTLEVLRRIYGDPPPVKDPAYFETDPFASVFDIRKAQRLLGWEPKYDWRHFEEWEL
ncbi:NAD-dependent epimerase/dehydratase family protein [Candidatus Poribacteria bacterium]|nr:NAD-dependent epimerase/dehydratase family protein [Candidatus Poribacteria bacterium]